MCARERRFGCSSARVKRIQETFLKVKLKTKKPSEEGLFVENTEMSGVGGSPD
jgi:hypothetical protein